MTTQRTDQFPGMPSQMAEAWSMMYGLIRTQVLHVAASLGIADLLVGGPMDSAQLAEATGCHADSLSRVLRCLASCDILALQDDGRYSLTESGQVLRSDFQPSLHAGAIFYGSRFIWEAWGSLLENVRTGKTAFEIVHGQPVFDYLAGRPDDLRINSDFMTGMARRRLSSATDGYDFPRAGLIVDVGGGEGAMLTDILQANPGLQGILFDLPEVAETARGVMATAGLGDRCSVLSGSFFEEVPGGGDVYVLSNILHDWDDEHCARILKQCRRVMQEGSKLLIVDAVMPERDLPFTLAAPDLQMMVVVGGKQRTQAQYREILQPSGFKLTQVVSAGLLEAEAVS